MIVTPFLQTHIEVCGPVLEGHCPVCSAPLHDVSEAAWSPKLWLTAFEMGAVDAPVHPDDECVGGFCWCCSRSWWVWRQRWETRLHPSTRLPSDCEHTERKPVLRSPSIRRAPGRRTNGGLPLAASRA